MANSVEKTSGVTLVTTGTIPSIMGEVVQQFLHDLPENARLAAYQALIQTWGKLPIDYLITSGEDLGIVFGAYGLNLISNHDFKLVTHALKIATLLAGTFNELVQRFIFENETFSVLDLAIFGIPLIWELAHYQETTAHILRMTRNQPTAE